MKKLLPFLVLLGLLLAAWRFIQYLALPAIFTEQVQESNAVPNSFKSLLSGSSPPAEISPVEWQVDTVVTGVQVPWSLAFLNESDFFFTERPGQIRLFQQGTLVEKPVYVFERVRSSQEQGLMGLTLHPDFAKNGFAYTCVSEPDGENYTIKISRLKASDPSQPTELTFDRDILTGIAGARVHAGCALVFGPDGKLYVATGDATQKGLAKDQNSLVGKILRLNDDGSRPADNPFAGSLVYSRGHRNPQGLAWHSNGSLYSTEHGPSVFDGPAGGDEVNRILAGEYYGWPEVSHEKTLEGARSPLALYTPAEYGHTLVRIIFLAELSYRDYSGQSQASIVPAP